MSDLDKTPAKTDVTLSKLVTALRASARLRSLGWSRAAPRARGGAPRAAIGARARQRARTRSVRAMRNSRADSSQRTVSAPDFLSNLAR